MSRHVEVRLGRWGRTLGGAGRLAALSIQIKRLAVSPFPLSLIRPPLRRIDASLLPPLGDYPLELVKRPGTGQASEALVGYVMDAFRKT
ncbi:hypothetical protein [Halomonas alkalisoli]|uniref:hypothetical protein n=1 Tax=Halomonas alkalisoli TaxID=2907158 RepID=UPI001F1E130F|nr:hypothetical protein [Halomonas alkalisoli]MCE9681909.1 hypothetical protein [Halomonas alkalisoli]